MPSHYDAAKKCRVGTMDEKQFFAECADPNGAYFRNLLADWAKAGGELKWGAGGVGLRGNLGAKAVGFCFVAPQFAGKQDRIELACATLAKQMGNEQCKKFRDALRTVAGDRVTGNTMLCIVQPGLLAAAKRKALTRVFLDLLQ